MLYGMTQWEKTMPELLSERGIGFYFSTSKALMDHVQESYKIVQPTKM
jgi:hypothetical protein